MDSRARSMLAAAIAAIAAIAACRSDPAQHADQAAARSSEPAKDCALADASGTEMTLDDLHDPVAALLLRGHPGRAGSCPTTLVGVLRKLAAVDADDCDGGMFSAVQSILVSEIAQARGTATGSTGCAPDAAAHFRSVTLRRCSDRPSYGLILAATGLRIGAPLPDDTELIGYDDSRGVFDYYALRDGTWTFFGDSTDMLAGPGPDGERKCAACHRGGGLVLKELRSPWVHWEGRDTLPGVTEILDQHPDLGSRVAASDAADGRVVELRPAGKELQDVVEAGNAAWTEARVQYLLDHGTTRALLEPLFCTIDVELRAASPVVSPPSSTDNDSGHLSISADALLLDPRLGVSDRITVPLSAYHAAISATGQRVELGCGAQLVDAGGRPVVDTAFDLVAPHRSWSDTRHVDALVRRGIVSERLAVAVASVDFTRPVFSDDRCGLLQMVPELPPPRRRAAAIEEALVAALRAAEPEPTSAAGTLLAALSGDGNPRASAHDFVKACAGRPPDALVRDLLAAVSLRRARARALPVLELRETMPIDDLEVPAQTRLDPRSCVLESKNPSSDGR